MIGSLFGVLPGLVNKYFGGTKGDSRSLMSEPLTGGNSDPRSLVGALAGGHDGGWGDLADEAIDDGGLTTGLARGGAMFEHLY